MVDVVISPVLTKLGAIIGGKITDEFNLVNGVKEELSEISRSLTTITKVLDDAEYKGMEDQAVKHWLNKLEITACEMADILEEWEYYSLQKQKTEPSDVQKLLSFLLKTLDCWFIPSSCLCFNEVSIRRDIAKKIQNVKATLGQILKEKNDFNFETNSQRRTDPVRDKSESSIGVKNVFGSDIHEKKNKIVSKLMLNRDGTQILSIVGDGGLGKTTLAQLIFNDPQFDTDWLKIWVCVSTPFVVDVVAANIVNSVGKETIPTYNDQPEVALQKLKASVSGKRYLLVLDDVWSEDRNKWRSLKNNLKSGAPGSKILVTTRSERVAELMGTLSSDIYHPEKLDLDECWSILREMSSLAKKTEEECKEFEEVGKKIASKCKGLPLAAAVLGTLLYFKDLEGWNQVEKSGIWELENARVELFPHLVLSYNDLSPDLKRCFSYCAVYPKDHKIHAETLIEEWMAQGYLGSDSGNGAVELKGRENLRNLAMRSLFQDIKKSESGEQIRWCKMHDIVHDFALYLRKNDDNERSCQVCEPSLVSHVQEYRSLSLDYSSPVFKRERSCQVCDCMKSLRVIRVERIEGPIPIEIETLIHLRWLDLSWIKLSKGGFKIICRLYFLQALLLLRCRLTEIPQEIGNLDQLRRLDLSENNELKELPDSMCKLVELRSLSLANCSLEVIPQQIWNLVKLRRLDLSENRRIQKLPEGIRSLVELQILKIEGTHINCFPEALGELRNLCTLKLCPFKVGCKYNKLGFLKKIHCRLIGSLDLEIYCSSMSEMLELVKDARQAQLMTLLQELETLKISFRIILVEMEQSSSSSSMWMEVVEALVPHHSLNRLEIREYEGSRLPRLMSSPFNFIKEIHLDWLGEVSSLPAMGKLPSLEILYIFSMRQLIFVGREFLGIQSPSDDDDAVVAFPKLETLKFYSCKKWEEWEDITEEEEESVNISIMPCLIYLTIESCVSLKRLPHRLLRKVSSSLRWLKIEDSSELIKTYGEYKEGSAWRSISQHNPKLHLQLPWKVRLPF